MERFRKPADRKGGGHRYVFFLQTTHDAPVDPS
jgi:hypothetical protein